MTAKKLLEILLLAVIYILTAKLSQAFAIPPGNVTPIWLPSGIILVWMLLRGNYVWPGIWLGAFIGNASAYWDGSSHLLMIKSLIAGALNGTGDSLGIYLAVYILRRYKAMDFLHRSPAGALFVFAGAMISSFVSACFGVAGLSLCGFIGFKDSFYVWYTWWIGDSVGVLLIAPALFAFFKISNPPINSGHSVKIAFPLLTAAILSVSGEINLINLGVHIPLLTVLPVLIWAVFQLDERWVFGGMVSIATACTLFTFMNLQNADLHQMNVALIELQLFLAVTTVTVLLLNGTVAELRKAQFESESANHAKNVFLGRMSHEFKTPLNAVVGFSSILNRKAESMEPQRLQETTQKIHSAGMHLSNLVSDMLDVASLQGASPKIRCDCCSLSHAVEESLKMCEPLLEKHPCTIHNFVKECDVFADPVRLKQIITNLLSNAIKYNKPQGQIQLTHKISQAFVQVSITDTGIGIPQDEEEFLFTPFVRLQNALHHSPDGLGIGLSLCKQLVEGMGGEIGYFRLENGSEFYFTIPLYKNSEP